MKQAAQRWLAGLEKIEDWLLAILVLILVALAGAQIILRNFFDTGLSWADPLLRALVLWTGMLGALAAVRDDKHIALDVLQRFLTPRMQQASRILTFGFAAVVCAAMAWFSVDLVKIDLTSGSNAFAGVPSWFVESILPAGFGLMALRFALRAFAPPAHVPLLLHEPDKQTS
jgi:TRAP-type C4-dicarboxylate transport system permease small subunit